MAECCVCGKDATVRARGMWWCERHYKYVEEKPEAGDGGSEKFGGETQERGGVSVELGLDWV